MDSKAQASSVFNLLISAVVALAVLAILLAILAPVFFPNDPAKKVPPVLKDAFSGIGSIKTTETVTFESTYSNLNSTGIANASGVGITPNQICLSLGDLSTESAIFEITNERNSINFKGSGKKDARISIYCYSGKEMVSSIEVLGSSGIKAEWADGCPCVNSENEEVCCLVALRFATH